MVPVDEEYATRYVGRWWVAGAVLVLVVFAVFALASQADRLADPLQADVQGRLIVHALRYGSLRELRAALIADAKEHPYPDDSILAGAHCTVGMLGYVDDNGDVQVLTARDIRRMGGR